ncbi:hypothetical protein D9758_015944 [Tetrapyrgos nigripes]|uniref:Uncharacterized protein n=1 Tax=Tetrapyrgos nigripes TaxID=182062 RepID=A0A8H5C9T3_9AGAR|nr:hypothetical protein D9758_015944 [Tetrapyrgos nigripes]
MSQRSLGCQLRASEGRKEGRRERASSVVLPRMSFGVSLVSLDLVITSSLHLHFHLPPQLPSSISRVPSNAAMIVFAMLTMLTMSVLTLRRASLHNLRSVSSLI